MTLLLTISDTTIFNQERAMSREVGTANPGPGGRYATADIALHVDECAKLLGSPGGRTAAIAWCKEQGFGRNHTTSVVNLAAKALVESQKETVDQTRARLLTMLENELEAASAAEDRTAIAAYTRLVVTLTGLDVRTVNHVHAKDRPLREMTTQQLIEEEERLAKEIAERATPVDAVVTDSQPVLNDDASANEDDHAA